MKKTLLLLIAVFVLTTGLAFADLVEWKIADGGNGHYYEAIDAFTRIGWAEANTAADALGGHLATITSQAENTFVCSY